ncbi:MAG: hypothetical protein IJU91_10380 [Selenomonadaceae bacterium]|nr:hypothetical protein [Selenomonadaceae bacterium]
MESYYDKAHFSYKMGTSENDNTTIGEAFMSTVNMTQGGYDVITTFHAEATTFFLGSGMLNVQEGGNNTVALTGEVSTVNLGESSNTNIIENFQAGSVAHIYGANLSTVRLALSADKTYSGTWRGENLNTLDLSIKLKDTDIEIASVHFYGCSDSNIPQLIGNGYICDRPQGETTEEELPPSLTGCSPAESETTELEEPPTLDEVITPTDGISGQSTFPSWIEPIEHGTGSKLVTTPPVTDDPAVTPTALM